METDRSNTMLPFSGHLEVLRWMLFRIIAVAGTLGIVIFCFKNFTWELLLAPSEYTFCTYKSIESILSAIGVDFHFAPFKVDLIATDLSSQFMTHITTSLYLGLLGTSPYVMFELFRFISPALYETEKKYSVQIVFIVYILFIFGILMSYYVLFPISFRFLGTYSVAEKIHSTITIDSYISTFTTLTLLMGVVFQLPIVSFFLGKMGLLTSKILRQYRKHSLIIIMLVAAIITPPDLITLILVTIPLYLLYEVSIWVVSFSSKNK